MSRSELFQRVARDPKSRALTQRALLAVLVGFALWLGACASATPGGGSGDASCGDGPACPEGEICVSDVCLPTGDTSNGGTASNSGTGNNNSTSTNNGTTTPNNGGTSTNNGTTSTNNGTTSTNNGTTSTNNSTTSTNNSTTSTNNSTTSTNNSTTSTNNSTTSTNNGTTSTNNGTTSTNNGTTGTNNNTTTPPAEYVGRRCGVDPARNCTLTSPSWPDCAAEPCGNGEGRCWAMSQGVGYCTVGCESDEACSGAEAGLVGDDFTCVVSDINGGLCMPGSNSPCTTDDNCAGGEVCKISAVVGSSGRLGFGLACQPPTAGGAPIGASCNPDPTAGPLELCAHDLCYGQACSAPCSGPGDARCGGGPLSCVEGITFNDFYSVGELEGTFCASADCANAADCVDPDFSCALTLEGLGDARTFGGACLPEAQDFGVLDLAELGEFCDDVEDAEERIFCRSQSCFRNQCTARCALDSECAANQACRVDVVNLSQTTATALKYCAPAEGSKTPCTGDANCGGGEVCTLYYQGDVSADGRLTTGGAAPMCTTPVAGGAATGQRCDGDAVCGHRDMCYFFNGSAVPLCSQPCATDADCPVDMPLCAQNVRIWDNKTADEGDDVLINICFPNGI